MNDEKPDKITISLRDIPIKWVMESIRELMREMGYEETMDLMTLSGASDVLRFDRGEEVIILSCATQGEPCGELLIQGGEKEVEDLVTMFMGKISQPMYRTLLSNFLGEERTQRILKKLESYITKEVRRAKREAKG